MFKFYLIDITTRWLIFGGNPWKDFYDLLSVDTDGSKIRG